MAAQRGAYIDQSQSLNLFLESPTMGKLSSMYMYGWKKGLKTTYYLRSRPATGITKVTTTSLNTDKEALSCSLENPEVCESCQITKLTSQLMNWIFYVYVVNLCVCLRH